MGFSLTRRGFAVGAVAVASGLSLWRFRYGRSIDARIESRLAAAAPPAGGPVDLESLDGLPDPVRSYFEAVIRDGQSPVRTVEIEQAGEFRLGGRTGDWKPMTATQYYTVSPPGFVWDAAIETFPLVPARVVDAYEDGDGTLEARILSLIPVAKAGPSPEMNEGELLRYLGEAVWFPTALLPSTGVAWEAIDAQSARATLEDGSNTASLVFHFDDEWLVDRVTGERYRQDDDRYAPWVGSFDAYEWHDGFRIPTQASVEWDLPDGPLPYWRAQIEAVEYTR